MKKGKRYLASVLAVAMTVGNPVQILAAGDWQYDQNKWYHITENQKDTGWLSEGQDIWYFLDADGVMQTGWYKDGVGDQYYLNMAGEGVEGQMRYGWYLDSQGAWYFLNTEHNGNFGKAVTGWAWIDGYCYCFGADGRMYADCQTPDGYEVDADGRWTVNGIIQKVEGKGFQSNHTHVSAVSFPGGGSGGSSGGGSGSSGGNTGGTDTSENGIYEKSNKKVFDTQEQVKTFDNTTKDGKDELRSFRESTLDIWVSDLPEPSEEDFTQGDLQEIQLLVSNDNPFYQYILDGTIEDGDVIHIPALDDGEMPLTLVYNGHDDDFSGDGEFDPELTEVIHTQETSLRQLLADEIQYAAGGVNAKDPLAFSWSFQYPGTEEISQEAVSVSYKLATESEITGIEDEWIREEDEIATASNISKKSKVRNGVQIATSSIIDEIATSSTIEETVADEEKQVYSTAPVSRMAKSTKAGEKFKVSLTNDKKTGKMKLELSADCVIYDGDGDTGTKNDQVKLNGKYEIRDFYPQMVIDWPLLQGGSLDFLPNQIMAKVSCEDEMSLGLDCSAKIDCKKIVKAINDVNMAHSNEYDFALFKIQGVDFSKSAVLWAGGINIGTGQIKVDMKSLQNSSKITPFAPTVVVMILLDVDGNITAQISADITKESYRELGINYQEKGYIGVGGTTQQNKGEENIDLGSHEINIYAKEWRSKTDSRPSGYTVTIEGDGLAEMDTSLNVGIGLMVAGLIPAAAKTGVGVDAELEGGGKIVMDSGTITGNLEGKASLELYTKAQALAKIKITFFGAEFGVDLSPEWKWSIFKKELDAVSLSAIQFDRQLQKYYESDYEELSRSLIQKSKQTPAGRRNEQISFTNNQELQNAYMLTQDSDIWIDYIKAGTDEENLIYDETNGIRVDEGVYYLTSGIGNLFIGLEEDTTFGEVLDATGITGRYWADGADSDVPCFIFEVDGYEYWLDFWSLALEYGNFYDIYSEAGLKEIETLVRNEKVKNNEITVAVDPPACKNVDVYSGVRMNEATGQKLASCKVPSGATWQNVIKLDGAALLWYAYGAHGVSFEFQADPVSSSGTDTITISCGNQKKTQKIYPGTNTIKFSWDTSYNGISVSIDGPQTLYIRNAVLDPQ